MDIKRQERAPIYEALEEFKKKRVVPFDVPGHKRGRGNPELVHLLGEKCVGLDVNSMKPLDNLCHPVSVIREAEELAADAFGAANAFLMVGGTTSAVQAMILSTCKAGDKIILPRNVHKSALNALVLCGAIPVYVNPQTNAKLGISLGMDAGGANELFCLDQQLVVAGHNLLDHLGQNTHAPLNAGDEQILFGRKVLVHQPNADPCVLGDHIDVGVFVPFGGKLLGAHFQYALPSLLGNAVKCVLVMFIYHFKKFCSLAQRTEKPFVQSVQILPLCKA